MVVNVGLVNAVTESVFLQDMDECLEPDYCEHGRCENFIGGFRCRCDSGYTKSDDNKTCVGKGKRKICL